jgi:nitroreductase
MHTFDAIAARRSIRKFRPEPVSRELLRELVEVTRLYPSGGNLQPLRFAIVTNPTLTDAVFSDLKWAMYLPDFFFSFYTVC